MEATQITTALGLAGAAFVLAVITYSEVSKLKKEIKQLKEKK